MPSQKEYRVRILNFPNFGDRRWINKSKVNDINKAFRIRQDKHNTSTKPQYVYQVEEYVEGML